MKVTGIEVDGERYKVVRADYGTTYCEECGLNEKCTRKDNEVYPCNMVGDEEIFVKE
jgi:hypothetical protein